MRIVLLKLLLILSFSSAKADVLIPLGVVDFNTSGSDVWGYSDSTGRYAIMGISRGVAIVNVDSFLNDPSDTTSILKLDLGANCIGRDMKTYRNYLYVSSDGCFGATVGIAILDLSFLPDSVRLVGFYYSSDTLSHNIYIDTLSGYMYAVGQYGDRVRIISLADPENPMDIGTVYANVHDMFVLRDTLYIAEGYDGSFSIYDVSDKTNPTLIARVVIDSPTYVHNVWVDETGSIAMTTEEVPEKTVKIWDISDPTNIVLLGEYLGANNLAHNVVIKRDRAYISHYSYGVVVLDISNPMNPMELANYDTYPQSDAPEFSGCWGVYPFVNDSLIYASNLDGKLFILKYDTISVNVEEPSFYKIFGYVFFRKPAKIEIYTLNGSKVLSRYVEPGRFVWRPRRSGIYIYVVDGRWRFKMVHR